MEKKLDNNFAVGAVLTDSSKAFDVISHDILIAKLLPYGLSEEVLMYILSYLSNCKHRIGFNDTCSEFENIITGGPSLRALYWVVFCVIYQ